VKNCLLDTGPLVALLVKTDKYHQRAKEVFAKITAPLITCEAVISEACFLMAKVHPLGPAEVINLGTKGFYKIDFALQKDTASIKSLLTKYKNIPMSLADACLVRLADTYKQAHIATFDSDFAIYRWGKNKRFVSLLDLPT